MINVAGVNTFERFSQLDLGLAMLKRSTLQI